MCCECNSDSYTPICRDKKDSQRYVTQILTLIPEHLSNYENAYGCFKSKVLNLKLQTILHFEICFLSGISRRRTTVYSDLSTPNPVDLNPCNFLLAEFI